MMDAFVVRSKRKEASKNSDKHQDSKLESRSDVEDDGYNEPVSKKLKTEPSSSLTNSACSITPDTSTGTQLKMSATETGQKITYSSQIESLQWKKIRAENLSCDYCVLLSKTETKELFRACEDSFTYNTGRLAQVQIFGQWRDIPRKQVAYGDAGLSYTFSGNQVPARPWLPFLEDLRDHISSVTGQRFNFVLINRYENGDDHMGEHRDDEKDLVRTSPIASLSLGQPRDFIFKHRASRGKAATRQIPTVTVELENGSLLMMNHPTNTYWYHSLPKRKRALGVRINMTFRDFVVKQKK